MKFRSSGFCLLKFIIPFFFTEMCKTFCLSGNSVYGHSIMDKSKHTKVTFCGIERASQLINDPFFHDLEEFDDMTFEVCTIAIKNLRYLESVTTT